MSLEMGVQLKALLPIEVMNVARAVCSAEGFVGDEVDERRQG